MGVAVADILLLGRILLAVVFLVASITKLKDRAGFRQWDGNVKTTLTRDGQPRTTFNGDWTWTKATGRYAAYTSSGRYTGYAPSPDKVYIEWEGQLQPR